MKATFTLITLLLLALPLSAQTTATFEALDLGADHYLNNAGTAGGFSDGNLFLPNDFNEQFDSWSGWAISATTDTETPGYLNQYSAITGQGQDGSSNYAVTYAPFPNFTSTLHLTGPAAGGVVEGFYITNGTYPYLSMLEGDGFAKKFGGETGDDPDFYRLTIRKYLNGVLSTDSIDFYLADYRFSDNSQDYIVNTWEYVDLSPLGNADSLLFTLASSDVGAAGVNTPTYFCIDNLTTRDMPVAVQDEVLDATVSVFPNPATDYLTISWPGAPVMNATIWTMGGQLLQRIPNLHTGEPVDIHFLKTGLYWLQVTDGEHTVMRKVVKE